MNFVKITFPMVGAQIVGQIVINKILNNKQSRTSSAGSATLRDTSWARLTIQLGASETQKKPIRGRNLPDFQLCLESKTQLSLAKAQNYMEFEN